MRSHALRVAVFLLLLLALLGCADSPTPGPTPKTGHWEGTSRYQGDPVGISFDVTADGTQITNFKCVYSQEPGVCCTDENVVEIKNGSFSKSSDFEATGRSYTNVFLGKFSSSTTLEGSFDLNWHVGPDLQVSIKTVKSGDTAVAFKAEWKE